MTPVTPDPEDERAVLAWLERAFPGLTVPSPPPAPCLFCGEPSAAADTAGVPMCRGCHAALKVACAAMREGQ